MQVVLFCATFYLYINRQLVLAAALKTRSKAKLKNKTTNIPFKNASFGLKIQP